MHICIYTCIYIYICMYVYTYIRSCVRARNSACATKYNQNSMLLTFYATNYN